METKLNILHQLLTMFEETFNKLINNINHIWLKVNWDSNIIKFWKTISVQSTLTLQNIFDVFLNEKM